MLRKIFDLWANLFAKVLIRASCCVIGALMSSWGWVLLFLAFVFSVFIAAGAVVWAIVWAVKNLL